MYDYVTFFFLFVSPRPPSTKRTAPPIPPPPLFRCPGRQPGLVRDRRAVVDTQRSQGKARLRPRFFLELAVLGGMYGRPYSTVSCRSAQREFSRQRVSSADCHGATRPATQVGRAHV